MNKLLIKPKTKNQKQMKTDIGISEKNLTEVSHILTEVLSDAMVLQVKTKKFHWNVTGSSFNEMHELFEKQYTQIDKAVDEIAERIRFIGHYSIGSMEEFLKNTSLSESLEKELTAKEMLGELLKDHESVIKGLLKGVDETLNKYEDPATSDFLNNLVEDHEKMAWMLRSYLS